MHCCETHSNHEKSAVHVDPVCGMKVENAHPKLVSSYNGQKYYFCAEACLTEFNRHPERSLAAKKGAPGSRKIAKVVKKGPWGRYLDRLAKVTGGKAVKCH